MKRRTLLLGAPLLAAPAIRTARAQAKPLVFGGSVPLTGAAAETGLNVNNGYLTAAAYLNDVMGGVEIGGEKYRLELKLFDDASDPARATTLIQRQIDDGTRFLPRLVRQQHRAAHRGDHRTGAQADGADRRRIGRRSSPAASHIVFGMYPRATRQFADHRRAVRDSLQPTPADILGDLTNDAFSKTAAEGVSKSCDEAGFKLLDRL